NPASEDKPELRVGGKVFRLGDKVMQLRNNYGADWRSEDDWTEGEGIFNGDVGVLTHIDTQAETATVDFDGRFALYSFEMLYELEPAFAMTVHKSQGSEYRAVLLALSREAPMLMTRGVLYTAVTRARELLILVGDKDVPAEMTMNDRRARRYSGLKTRLSEAV
ncbi:MAG: ATP-dependent RecD-like DNA helicase, partial [Oscillospiraceae bacterium]|nr:ATP-dependent RecD-like DNA helicase [Oscillospiraceae bacterium]